MDSVSEENIVKKEKELKSKRDVLEIVIATTIEEMWLKELDTLEKELGKIPKKIKKMKVI